MVAIASNVIPLEPTGAHPPGYLLGERYRLRSLVGPTSNGAIYLASDTARASTAVGRDVLVRLLDAPWADGAENLLRGSHIAKPSSAITHANVARLVDLGTDAGRAYYVMQWIDHGMLLSEYVPPTEGLDLDTFVPIAAQILKAVGHAHSRSTFFGDIDASGAMLGRRKGREHYVVLTSFGLTQDVARDPSRRTPYMAPESAESSAIFSLQRDVYALGVLFWYMLSGEFPSGSAVPSLRASVPGKGIPQPLAELIEECLATNPDDRPADANVVIERMIDVIPAKLFRLPRIEPAIPGELPGAGNTGLIDLTGVDPSGEFERPTGRTQTQVADRDDEGRRTPWALLGFGLVAAAAIGAFIFGGFAPWSNAEPPAPTNKAELVASAVQPESPEPTAPAIEPRGEDPVAPALIDAPPAAVPAEPAESSAMLDQALEAAEPIAEEEEAEESAKPTRRRRRRTASPAPKKAAPDPEPAESIPEAVEPEPAIEEPAPTPEPEEPREPLLPRDAPIAKKMSDGLMDSVLTRDDGLMKPKDDQRGSLMPAD